MGDKTDKHKHPKAHLYIQCPASMRAGKKENKHTHTEWQADINEKCV